LLLAPHLPAVPQIGAVRSHSVTAENPTGAKGAGGRAASPLGVGRKGRPCLRVEPGETYTLADIEGPGVVRHIWMTVPEQTDGSPFVLRNLVLRVYWDGHPNPSVEVPLGDFFCNGFGRRCLVASIPIAVAPTGGMNCYFAMPFASSARVTVTSEHPDVVNALFFQIDYHLVDELPDRHGYFHAQWRRQPVTTLGRDYVILDGARGPGMYVGTYLGVAALQRYWWGEGEVKFYLDGDHDWPTICGTGLEDYFGGAWGFLDGFATPMVAEHTFSYPYVGYPLYEDHDQTRTSPYGKASAPMHGMYRWHLPDPIHFDHDVRATVQQIGHEGRELFERRDDVTSVAYWYQLQPHEGFPPLPDARARQPR